VIVGRASSRAPQAIATRNFLDSDVSGGDDDDEEVDVEL
jgi:hypothetical protein